MHDQLRATMDQARSDGDDPPFRSGVKDLVSTIESQSRSLLRFGLFGEFSAGKSTLANLLICIDMLPTSVLSSTRVPTRLRYGPELALDMRLKDGRRQRLTVDAAKNLDRHDVDTVDIRLPNDLLRYVEFVDTPGFSDPYHDPEQTLTATKEVDVALWCTLATQAWRYSEQVIWSSLPSRLQETGILVVTHKDSLSSRRDRDRVLGRLEREAGDLFNRIVMISIPDAIRARAADGSIIDPTLWRESGGEALLDGILDSLKLATLKRHERGTGEATSSADLSEAEEELSPEVVDLLQPELTLADAAEPDADDNPPTSGHQDAVVAGDDRQTAPSLETVGGLLTRALDAIPGCSGIAYVDMQAGRTLCSRMADERQPDSLDGIVHIATDLFEAKNVQAIEPNYFQEIIASSGERLCLLMRSRRRQHCAMIFAVNGSANMGLALVRSRAVMTELDRLL